MPDITNKGLMMPFTDHAVARCQQRGISRDVVNLVLANFDRDHHAGGGAAAISISKGRLRDLERAGYPIQLLERAARTVLLIAESGAIITVINRATWFARFHRGADRLRSRHFPIARRRFRGRR
jgi:hypothetical protein